MDKYKNSLKGQVDSGKISLVQAAQQASEMWKNESPDVRQKYEAVSRQNSEAKQQERKSILEKLNEKEVLLLNTIRMLPHVSQFRGLPDKNKQLLMSIPRAPPSDGRLLFVSEMYKQKSDGQQQQVTNIQEGAAMLRNLMHQWKALPESQKASYDQKVQTLWKQYEQDLETFLH